MRHYTGLAVALLTAIACDSGKTDRPSSASNGPTGGTIVISAAGDPDVLFPPLLTSLSARQVSELVYDHLADLGASLNTTGDTGFQPRLAKSWTWSPDSLSITFHLDPRARWHDGLPVRASDVAFTYALYKDSATASPSAPLIVAIDSVTTPDSLTAVFWYSKRSPLQFFEAVNPMLILPEHALEGVRGKLLLTSVLARAPIGSGRFRFVAWNAGSFVDLAADTGNYYGRPQVDRVMWSIAPDANTAFTRLLGGESDVLEQVTAANLPQVSRQPLLKTVVLAGMEYNFIQFNFRDPGNAARPHPLFADRNLRRALTMAVDRARTVRNTYDTLAAVALGPTVRAYPTTDTTLVQIDYSPDRARQLLDSLGWRVSGSDGFRRRNGQALEFTLSVPSSSRNRMNMAVVIQDQMKQVGVKMNIDKMEGATFFDRETHSRFDAALWGWHVDASPEGIRQTWGSARSRPDGGSNYGSYANPVFDAAVERALAATDNEQRRALFKRAHQLIIDDAPAIWLAEPRTMMAINSRIRTPALRPDAWWANIGEWSVPAAGRIARDRRASQ